MAPAVADAIRADPETYSDLVLGSVSRASGFHSGILRRKDFRQPREKYISTILKSNSWGGAIELAALSDLYKTEIGALDEWLGGVIWASSAEGGWRKRFD
jgi:ubiquitin thioesterase OTU1